MSEFSIAIPTILRHEGRYSNNPADSGGATNFGVSLRYLKQAGLLEELELEEGDPTHNDMLAIQNMTKDEACEIYLKKWWTPYGYSAFNAQVIGTKVFDTAVNLGAGRAHKMLQFILHLTEDGVLGPKSYNEANAFPAAALLISYQNSQAQFYRNLVAANPARQQFLNGWLARAYDRN